MEQAQIDFLENAPHIVKVPSKSSPDTVYMVNTQAKTCTCPGFVKGHHFCSHLQKVFGELNLTQAVSTISKDQKELMRNFEAYTRTRLSKHFILRDFLYSSEAEILGIPNRPSDSPFMVAKAGKALCEKVLEPLLEAFGPFAITYGYQTRKVIEAWRPNEKPTSSQPHQWDRGTYGDEIYARVDIMIYGVQDGIFTREEVAKWMMYHLDIDLLMMWRKSNVFCITIGPKNRRVWLEWTPQGQGTGGGNKIEHMGEQYWNSVWPGLDHDHRPKFGPSGTGGKMW